MQVLIYPRPVPKKLPLILNCFITLFLLLGLLIALSTCPAIKNVLSKYKRSHQRSKTPTTAPPLLPKKQPSPNATFPNKLKVSNLSHFLSLSEVVAYEEYVASFNKLLWSTRHDDVVVFHGPESCLYAVNVNTGYTYPCLEQIEPKTTEQSIEEAIKKTRDDSDEEPIIILDQLSKPPDASNKTARAIPEGRELLPGHEAEMTPLHVADTRRDDRGGHGRKRRSLEHNTAKAVRIGRTDWIVHTALQKRPGKKGTYVNLAVSRDADYDPLRSVSQVSPEYKPLLDAKLSVTLVLHAAIISEDEAMVYFVATPVKNWQYRYLYRMKIVFPPLEYSTLEPLQCLTCPSATTSNLTNFELSAPGHEPQCSYAEVLLSPKADFYLLKCMGEEVPWAVVVSLSRNLVLRRLEVDAEKRRGFGELTSAREQEFTFNVTKEICLTTRLYLPADWTEGCSKTPKLILRLADSRAGQMVDKQHELSVTTYLTTVLHYAVLYADVRGSKFHSSEYIGLKYRQRELMQIEDYVKLVKLVAKANGCIDTSAGFGVFGAHYGGHMALNLAANKNIDFRCTAAISPMTPWHAYVYPFVQKAGESPAINDYRRRVYKSRVMSLLVRRLRERNFVLYVPELSDEDDRVYMDGLMGLIERQGVRHELKSHGDDQAARLATYEHLSDFFNRCFRAYRETADKVVPD